MRSSSISFHHPVAFWLGCLLVLAGVLSHVPMFMMGRHTHWQMVGMPMSVEMWVGMALIPLGLALSMYGLMPRLQQMRQTAQGARDQRFFHIADGMPLNREHWTLVVVLIIALTTLSLLAFALMGWMQLQSANATIVTTAALLVSVSGVIAMLIPYTAEIYPVHLRATGSGVIAAGSKFGGILGAGLALSDSSNTWRCRRC